MFKEGYAPLLESGRLGAILMQFPWSFRNSDDNRAYVSRLKARFQEYPLVLEVRHASCNGRHSARAAEFQNASTSPVSRRAGTR